MKPIIVIEIVEGMGIDKEVVNPYGYELFVGDKNIEAQWKKLEELRKTGGVIIVKPDAKSAVHEILKPFINGAGWLVGCGLKQVHTKEHGDFCIILFHNPPKDMIQKIHTYQEEE